MQRKWTLLMGVAAFGLTALITGCKGLGVWGPPDINDPMGDVSIDGSTTVYPIVQAMAEDFKAAHSDYSPSVNKSGTGSGFQKFSRGEIDIAAASRPIDATEDQELKQKGIDYIEIPIAYDGVSVVVNPKNSWVDHLTLKELRNAWSSGSSVKQWSDIRSSFPNQTISFHGPTDNHGTYEYFTEAVNGKKNDLRPDCQKDQEYNSIIQAVAGDIDSMAYVGFNYYDQNRDKVKIVPIDSGAGAIVPSAETIANGVYAPLSRPLFLYVSKRAYDRKVQVRAFVQFALSEAGDADVKESSYVVLPRELHAAIMKHVQLEKTGTLFSHTAPGAKLINLYNRPEGK